MKASDNEFASLLLKEGTTAATPGAIDVTQAPYNAVGDDTTDDTTAIQAAFDAYPAGATIYFPPGTYKITSLITTRRPTSSTAGRRP